MTVLRAGHVGAAAFAGTQPGPRPRADEASHAGTSLLVHWLGSRRAGQDLGTQRQAVFNARAMSCHDDHAMMIPATGRGPQRRPGGRHRRPAGRSDSPGGAAPGGRTGEQES